MFLLPKSCTVISKMKMLDIARRFKASISFFSVLSELSLSLDVFDVLYRISEPYNAYDKGGND